MDIFKQNLAPIPKEAWAEINNRAEVVLGAYLTTRKSLLVNGPFGLEKTSVSTGRLNIVENGNDEKVKLGIYENQNLVETRISFKLARWEMDNVIRGAKDLDLSALEEAVKQIALFEEDALYNGKKAIGIKGLLEKAVKSFPIGKDAQAILDAVSKGVVTLKAAFAEKPYNLIVGKTLFQNMNTVFGNKLLYELVEKLIGGNVILSEVVKGGLLLPVKHRDLEFTVGQDYTIGYQNHDSENINLFIMNSYILRILDPNILVRFE